MPARSWSATPPGARTATNMSVGKAPGNVFGTPADEKNAVTVSLNVIYKF